MAFSTPTDSFDEKMKQILQEIVDENCFEIYETHKKYGDNYRADNVFGGKEIGFKIGNKLEIEEIHKSRDINQIYQISSAMGNMIVIEIINNRIYTKIIW